MIFFLSIITSNVISIMAIVPFPNYNVVLWCSNLTEHRTALGISLLGMLNWIKEHGLFPTEFPLISFFL